MPDKSCSIHLDKTFHRRDPATSRLRGYVLDATALKQLAARALDPRTVDAQEIEPLAKCIVDYDAQERIIGEFHRSQITVRDYSGLKK